MDNQHLKNAFNPAQIDTDSDNTGGDVTTRKSLLGDVIVVRVRQSLDLTVFFTFMNAVETANANPSTEIVLIDLRATALYFESGGAMLQLLREQLRAPLRDRIFLINARPEIKQRLELELPPADFHVGLTTDNKSSVKLH